MGGIPEKIKTWQMIKPWTKEGDKMIPGVIEQRTIAMPSLKAGEVIVEIAGCGVCHTDLGYFYDGVPPFSNRHWPWGMKSAVKSLREKKHSSARR